MQILHINRSWGRFASVAALILATSVFSEPRLHAATIGADVTQLGSNLFQYGYTITGFDLLANQQLDIFFDPTVYLALSNGVAPSDFNLLVFQPDSPFGALGDYSALALINHPSLAGPFTVDFSLLAGVTLPNSQPFTISQFDSSGHFVSTITSGEVSAVPEPSSGVLVLGAVAITVVLLILGRFFQYATRPRTHQGFDI